MEDKGKYNPKRLETDQPPYYDLLTGEYLGVFKTKEKAKEYFVSAGMSESDYDWLEENKHSFNESKSEERNSKSSVDDIVIGGVIATYKNGANTEQTLSKHNVITKLRGCNYRTSPKLIASLLDSLFSGWGTKTGWWLYVAQHWNPKSINGVISRMGKQHQRGEANIQNPAKYFTHLIKLRPKKKKFRGSNDTRNHKKD